MTKFEIRINDEIRNQKSERNPKSQIPSPNFEVGEVQLGFGWLRRMAGVWGC